MQKNRELSLNTRRTLKLSPWVFAVLNAAPQSLPPGGFAVLNDTPVACQTREPTDPQGDRCPHIPAASAATYPLRCFAPQWARFDNRHSTSAPAPILTAVSGAGIVSRPGASAFFVSDGPISSNSGRNGGKNAGRNCVSALPQRATVGCDFPHLLAGIAFCRRCRSKGLCLRSPARRLTRPLAPATVGVFLSYRRTPQAFPSRGPCC